MRRRILVIAMIVAAAGVLFVTGGRAEAKGPTYVVVGGGDLSPYYYAIPQPGPVGGWLGLLANDASAGPGQDRPVGMIDAPPDSAALLAGAYEVYFGDLEGHPGPHARYVPADATHRAYLYWQTPSGGMQYVSWFALEDAAAGYLDDAIHAALSARESGGTGLETDWIAAFLLHGPYYTGADGSPAVRSDTYWISDQRSFSPGMTPLATLTGDDAAHLLDAYIATLHHWHEIPRGGLPGGYKVFTPAGRELFTFAPTLGAAGPQVMPAEAGGVYDADPALDALLMKALGLSTPFTVRVTAEQPGRSAGKALAVAAIAGGALVAALGGIGVASRRRVRGG